MLALALLSPWGLGALAYAASYVCWVLYCNGLYSDGLVPVVFVWFYTFGVLALFALVVWFLFGVWRLVRRPAYRQSWCGWWWPVLTGLNLYAVVAIGF
jgi:hypothetical protein